MRMSYFGLRTATKILIWRLNLLIACVTEPGSGGKVNEDFCFKTLYNLDTSFLFLLYKVALMTCLVSLRN